MFSSTLKRSFATLGVVAGLLAAAGPAAADTSAPAEGLQSREAARTVTMLDYMGSPVVTYAPRGVSLGRESSIEV